MHFQWSDKVVHSVAEGLLGSSSSIQSLSVNIGHCVFITFALSFSNFSVEANSVETYAYARKEMVQA